MTTLADYIAVFDDALPAALCTQLVRGFEDSAPLHVRNGRTVRKGLEESAWTELDIGRLADSKLLQVFNGQIAYFLDRYNAERRLSIPVPRSARADRLILKRYLPGGEDGFQPHFDSLGEVSNRYLVFLWYLNDVADGGATEFVDLQLAVQPRAGRLLMFPPYWMFQHAGRPPVSGPKYILSTYLLF